MKRILISETSTSSGGLGLVECADDLSLAKLVHFSEWHRDASHSEVVTAAVKQILNISAIEIGDVTHFAAGIGPGSFTGIRVGLNMMRTFAYCNNATLFGFSSLRALGLSAKKQSLPVVCLVNAFKNMVYGAKYLWKSTDDFTEVIGPRAWTLDQLDQLVTEPSLVVGDGLTVYQGMISPSVLKHSERDTSLPDEPRIELFAEKLILDLRPEELSHWKSVKPLYFRASEAEEKLKSGLLKILPKI